MQCLYWLVQSEIPHTTKYGSLIDAVQFNAKYKSQRIIGEILQIMAVQIEKEQLQGVLSSACFSLMIDETTDVAILNKMVIYARYIEKGKVVTNFLKICKLFNGTICWYHWNYSGSIHGGQGAFNVKNGWSWHWWNQCDDRCTQSSGCKAQMAPTNSYLHSLCVPLFSACSSSNWKWHAIHLQQIQVHTITAIYFYHNSAVWMSGLQEIKKLLESPELKLKKPAGTWWLSHENACQTLVRAFPALCISLSWEAEERGDALAVGLSNVVRKYDFVALLYMMCDVLSAVSRLSCVLQSSCIDLSQLHSLVSCTIEALELLCVSTGPRMNTLDADLEN